MASREKKSKSSTSIRTASTAKAGKRSGPYIRPPKPRRSVAARDARHLRRRRANGAFGAAPVHVWNHLIIGTNGREKLNAKQLSALAKAIREAQKAGLYDEEDVA